LLSALALNPANMVQTHGDDGFEHVLANSSVQINYAEGCKLWSSDQPEFSEALEQPRTQMLLSS
jgi:hypothetical protein